MVKFCRQGAQKDKQGLREDEEYTESQALFQL